MSTGRIQHSRGNQNILVLLAILAAVFLAGWWVWTKVAANNPLAPLQQKEKEKGKDGKTAPHPVWGR